MRPNVKRDWEWSDGHLKIVSEILRDNSMKLLKVSPANPTQDLKKATDLIIQVDRGKVAVRVRRRSYVGRYRDLTIRSWRASGAKTELDKIKKGFGDWYLYAWSDGHNGIVDWLLVDLNKLRESGLLDRKTIKNRDGITGFIAIKDKELAEAGCLVDSAKEVAFQQKLL